MELESGPRKGRTDDAEAVSEEQIIGILKEAEAGAVVTELCRRYGLLSATYCAWTAKFGNSKLPARPATMTPATTAEAQAAIR